MGGPDLDLLSRKNFLTMPLYEVGPLHPTNSYEVWEAL